MQPDSLLSTGQRGLESYILMDFLFGVFSFTAALPTQAFQEHSTVGCDLNQKHSGKLNSTTRQESSLPSPYESYHKQVLFLCG